MISEKELRSTLHELNNVFTIVISSADLLLLDLPEGSTSREDVQNILQACTKGCGIIEKLRTSVVSGA